MSGASLLSWFSLGLLAGAASATVVPFVGPPLAFLVVLCGLLAALLAHAVAERRADHGALTRVAAAYVVAAASAVGVGLWPIGVILAAGATATIVQAHGWQDARPRTLADV